MVRICETVIRQGKRAKAEASGVLQSRSVIWSPTASHKWILFILFNH
jgi:hypothetical protein